MPVAIRVLAWTALVGASLLATRWAWRAPAGYPAPSAPAPLPRATPEERALTERRAAELSAALAGLGAEEARAATSERLEARLPGGIPDNPLVSGRGGLRLACPATPSPEVDWTWCPDSGALAAGGLQ